MKLLLHTCCGPCFLGVWQDLSQTDFEVTNYFYNPNIQPKEEYELRLKNLKIVVAGKTKGIVEEKYDPNEHLEAVSSFVIPGRKPGILSSRHSEAEPKNPDLDPSCAQGDGRGTEGDSCLRRNDTRERCIHCYMLRLNQTAKYAAENGFDAFSTTLLISPYQKHEELIMIGREMGKKYNVVFYSKDFRPHFREGQNLAKEIDIYRQKYCGCKYSLAERNS